MSHGVATHRVFGVGLNLDVQAVIAEQVAAPAAVTRFTDKLVAGAIKLGARMRVTARRQRNRAVQKRRYVANDRGATQRIV